MKKTYMQPSTTLVTLSTQRLMDTWSVTGTDVTGGGTSSDNFYRVRSKSVWGDEDDEDWEL
ncbi:MAG: hypothetical protein IJ243_07685 [Prevotella sp.]|nr:hypothetical protein [Prevotella sp.]